VRWLEKRGWARHGPQKAEEGEHEASKGVMLVGCFRTGSFLVHKLRERGVPVTVIDFNPHLREQLEAIGVTFVYGDISHLDTLEHSGVEHARALVVPISDDFLRGIDNAGLLAMLRKINPAAKVIVTATSADQARELYKLGADYVALPELVTADAIISAIDAALGGKSPSPLSGARKLDKSASLEL
jgi:CPA2 family monovalent cation:H+ antiporter-2